ncbi:hypothetical protein HNR72_002516 [Streptomyces collinus]|uniref:Uncharacterized protein n=1 Tax=Streptomyces collinus TaxID=42684 RepID=A0AA89PZX5_STRCU|nr:hypothetical protein [Streptomyces collinus]
MSAGVRGAASPEVRDEVSAGVREAAPPEAPGVVPAPVRGAVPSEAGSVVLPGGKGAVVGVGRWVSGRLRVGRGWVLVMTLYMGVPVSWARWIPGSNFGC